MARISLERCSMQTDGSLPKATVTVSRQPAEGVDGTVLLDISISVSFGTSCRLAGQAGEDVSGWAFGFVQLKHTSTDWAVYRGTTAAEGSIFAAMDRPPARVQQLCLDCDSEEHRPFYDGYGLWPTTTGRTVVFPPGTAFLPHRKRVLEDYVAGSPILELIPLRPIGGFCVH